MQFADPGVRSSEWEKIWGENRDQCFLVLFELIRSFVFRGCLPSYFFTSGGVTASVIEDNMQIKVFWCRPLDLAQDNLLSQAWIVTDLKGLNSMRFQV
jgi:hypothetical protein